MKPKLLIVDDDEEIRTQMKWALSGDYEVILAEDRVSALSAFMSGRPAVTLLDLGLPPNPNSASEGLATLAAIRSEDGSARVIIISGQGEKENAIQAVGGEGACDFHCKPVNVEELRVLLRSHASAVAREREYEESQKDEGTDSFEGMFGRSAAMQEVFGKIRKVAASNAPVLILGKSGTGKEMAAWAIHRLSSRREAPFVAINCNAIPETLMESELFGHEKGSFTGANTQRKGHIESADKGTLFLDEIGEMPQAIQVKLLRFTQEMKFQRVGGRVELASDVRIVAATNADLTEMVAAGTFREDFYFRLAVISINLPALKDRGEDIVLIAKEFLGRFGKQNGKRGLQFTPDAIQAMLRHGWSGNIRELQNRVQRAVIMADSKRIGAKDLELPNLNEGRVSTLKEAREGAERDSILAALNRNQWNISASAAELGVSRPTLYELIEKLGIAKE